jgi:hypothetical protein
MSFTQFIVDFLDGVATFGFIALGVQIIFWLLYLLSQSVQWDVAMEEMESDQPPPLYNHDVSPPVYNNAGTGHQNNEDPPAYTQPEGKGYHYCRVL